MNCASLIPVPGKKSSGGAPIGFDTSTVIGYNHDVRPHVPDKVKIILPEDPFNRERNPGEAFDFLELGNGFLLQINEIPHGKDCIGIDIDTNNFGNRTRPLNPFQDLVVIIGFYKDRAFFSRGFECFNSIPEFFIGVSVSNGQGKPGRKGGRYEIMIELAFIGITDILERAGYRRKAYGRHTGGPGIKGDFLPRGTVFNKIGVIPHPAHSRKLGDATMSVAHLTKMTLRSL